MNTRPFTHLLFQTANNSYSKSYSPKYISTVTFYLSNILSFFLNQEMVTVFYNKIICTMNIKVFTKEVVFHWFLINKQDYVKNPGGKHYIHKKYHEQRHHT